MLPRRDFKLFQLFQLINIIITILLSLLFKRFYIEIILIGVFNSILFKIIRYLEFQ